jgi:hypothetical protein
MYGEPAPRAKHSGRSAQNGTVLWVTWTALTSATSFSNDAVIARRS